jgi:hypothetical protein
LFSLLLSLPLSVGGVGFDGCSCEGEGGLFDKGGPGTGGVPVSSQFLIVGSHGDKGVSVFFPTKGVCSASIEKWLVRA